MQNDMRDRLIALLKQIRGNEIALADYEADILIDHLLENGVIVPTLRCGDRVWFIPKGLDEVYEATVIRVEYNYFTSPQEWIAVDYISSIVGNHEYKSRIDLMIGKTVFLTKEEAERALAERMGKEYEK